MTSASAIEISDLVDKRPIDRWLIGLTVLCALVLAFEGYDTQAIGYDHYHVLWLFYWGCHRRRAGLLDCSPSGMACRVLHRGRGSVAAPASFVAQASRVLADSRHTKTRREADCRHSQPHGSPDHRRPQTDFPGPRSRVCGRVSVSGPPRRPRAAALDGFFMNLVTLYFLTNWVTIITNDAGVSVSEAVLITAMFQ